MRRRAFIAGLGGVAAWPALALGQQANKTPRIGFLATGFLGSPETSVVVDAFQLGLRELGYVEGSSILVNYREAGSKIERFADRATELMNVRVDIIVASNTPAARAAQRVTTTTPIVVPVMADPVRDGLVASLARPGGNITGLTFLGPELLPKRLALLKEALPKISRVAALWHPGAYAEPTMNEMMDQAITAASILGLEFRPVAADGPDKLEAAFSKIATDRVDAVLLFPSPMLFVERRRIVDLANSHRLPLMAMGKEFAELGGLAAYGASIPGLFRRSANYVDRIIKGAKPAELPVEQPTKFDLTINLKAAKELGVTISNAVLARADEVIE